MWWCWTVQHLTAWYFKEQRTASVISGLGAILQVSANCENVLDCSARSTAIFFLLLSIPIQMLALSSRLSPPSNH